MNVGYLGPLRDYSGYGEASRNYVAALDAAGVTVVPQLVNYVSERSDFGELGQRIDQLITNNAGHDYDIKILHTTPDEYHRFTEAGKYHIGKFFWETDTVPEPFAKAFGLVDEIWTGSKVNEDAIRRAGYGGHIFVCPQPTDTGRTFPEPYENPEFKDRFVFYSIFEWTDRKNPLALLRAYLTEFKADEPVALLIKTYFRNFTLTNKRMIREQIRSLMAQLGVEDKHPPIYLYTNLMDRRQVMRIHSSGDCFVSAHRGEGWGVPQVEAMLAVNPVISTNFGGVHEYLTDNKNANLIEYKLEPVHGMAHSDRWYTPAQKWAELNRESLEERMRRMFDFPADSARIGQAGHKLAKKLFNFERVGGLMAARLAEIQEAIK